MADTLHLNVKASLDWLFKETLDLSTVSDASRLEYAAALADGTGAGQADKLWHDTRTLASGASDDLDLTALTQSVFGSTLTISLARVRAVLIKNRATTSGENLTIGGGTNPFVGPFGAGSHTVSCPADSCILLVNKIAGFAVTDATGDILKILNAGAGSITYDIVIVGTSA